jgi:hypothetical protein
MMFNPCRVSLLIDCGHQGTYQCHAESSVKVVTDACRGKKTCSIAVSASLFGGDPCPKFAGKWLSVRFQCSIPTIITAAVHVPVASTATVAIPYYALNHISVTESNKPIFANSNITISIIDLSLVRLVV